ncbi:DUF401 family protein [bacterium]|nr:DUF401 family protein [bacterium]
MDLIILLGITILTALLIWRKVDLGLSLLIGSTLVGIFFMDSFTAFFTACRTAVTDAATLQLIALVCLILIMGALMKAGGNLKNIVGSLERLIKDKRVAMSIPPALIGLLPSPGGAMLSAPIVEEAGDHLNLSAEQKTFVNYWFRHLWEYFWPLYPGLIIASAILSVTIPDMMRVQYPLSIGAIISGFIVGLMPIKNFSDSGPPKVRIRQAVLGFAVSLWPIWVILIGLMLLKLPILLILGGIVAAMLFIVKLNWNDRWKLIKKAVSWKIVLLLFAVMIFKQVISDSSAVEAIPVILEQSGISPYIPLAVIPFLIGLLTGVNQAYVGMGFPLLLPLFGGEAVDLKLVMYAYTTGFAGVLLSPVHLCLLLTREYFKASWGGIYRQLIPAVGVTLLAMVILLVI